MWRWSRLGCGGFLNLEVGDLGDINVNRVGVEDGKLIAVLCHQCASVLRRDGPVLERCDEGFHMVVHVVERGEASGFWELCPVGRGAVFVEEGAEEGFGALVPASGLVESTAIFAFGAVGGRELPVVGVGFVLFELLRVKVLKDQQLCFGVGCITEIPCTGSLGCEVDAGFVGVWKEIKEVECGEVGGLQVPGWSDGCLGTRVLRGSAGAGAMWRGGAAGSCV